MVQVKVLCTQTDAAETAIDGFKRNMVGLLSILKREVHRSNGDILLNEMRLQHGGKITHSDFSGRSIIGGAEDRHAPHFESNGLSVVMTRFGTSHVKSAVAIDVERDKAIPLLIFCKDTALPINIKRQAFSLPLHSSQHRY